MSANCQFEENMALIKMDESFNNSQLLVATGCSLNHSWMGGFSCHQSLFPDLSLPDYKWVGAGGFGGGGGSCKGGGGGGGFIGKLKIHVTRLQMDQIFILNIFFLQKIIIDYIL